jgi:hypothetical protein
MVPRERLIQFAGKIGQVAIRGLNDVQLRQVRAAAFPSDRVEPVLQMRASDVATSFPLVSLTGINCMREQFGRVNLSAVE